jgi:uncharacterized protein (DUF2267 family)
MTYDQFIEEVCWQSDVSSRQRAERAIQATLETVGERLDARDADQLASQLPGPIAEVLRRARSHRSFGVEELFTHVRDREPVRLREAVEHAKVICQVLAEALDRDGQALLRDRLPPEGPAPAGAGLERAAVRRPVAQRRGTGGGAGGRASGPPGWCPGGQRHAGGPLRAPPSGGAPGCGRMTEVARGPAPWTAGPARVPRGTSGTASPPDGGASRRPRAATYCSTSTSHCRASFPRPSSIYLRWRPPHENRASRLWMPGRCACARLSGRDCGGSGSAGLGRGA